MRFMALLLTKGKMMKRTFAKKLNLKKSTVAHLGNSELRQAVGGYQTDEFLTCGCHTNEYRTCDCPNTDEYLTCGVCTISHCVTVCGSMPCC